MGIFPQFGVSTSLFWGIFWVYSVDVPKIHRWISHMVDTTNVALISTLDLLTSLGNDVNILFGLVDRNSPDIPDI